MPERTAVTSYDVAKRVGVSQATVSLVLNGGDRRIRVSEATKLRVREAARELGYVPNHAARSLSSRRAHTITVLTYGLDNPYYLDLVLGIQQAASDGGYAVNVLTIRKEWEQDSLTDQLAGGSSDAIIGAGGYDAVTLAALRHLSLRGIPVVAAGWARKPDRHIPTIRVDFEAGGCLATQHLVDLGHTRIAHVTDGSTDQYKRRDAHRHPDHNPVSARVLGYHRALRDAGIELRPDLMLPRENSPAGGAGAALELMSLPPNRRPTAIFFFNDYMALGGLHALWKAGIRVPEDVSVIGFDGTSAGALTAPELTTVDVHGLELGARAVDYALRRIEGRPPPRKPLPPPTLVVRASTGRPGRQK